MIRLGIDVGGTNTDGVLLDENDQVMTSSKTPTTEKVFHGIEWNIKQLLANAFINKEDIKIATLGTTHCTNAIIERKSLNRVGVVRISLPSGTSVPSLTDWPQDLINAINPIVKDVSGGYDYDGTPIADMKEAELEDVLTSFRGKVESIAVIGVFSPVLDKQEKQVAAFLSEYLPDLPISLSSKIGSIGLIERENATILNAALMTTIENVVTGYEEALIDEGIHARVFLGQNDGTLMTSDYAMQYPIFTIACGPTNSVRGAAHLSNETEAIVVDIGGTTTDIGVLKNGFPRQTSIPVEVGGVRTNYRMPDIYSIGIGGGTKIHFADDEWTVGPDSVGYLLEEKAIIFGGDELTATDVAVGNGLMDIEHGFQERLDAYPHQSIHKKIVETVEVSIDRMKTEDKPVPVVLVGGGATLMPQTLKGAEYVSRPEHASVANAIGAALGDVSGTLEKIYLLNDASYSDIIAQVKEEVTKRAIEAGADPDQITIIQLEDNPLAYLPGNAIVVKAKAAGPLLF